MKCLPGNKFCDLNFNIKHEIFSYFQLKDIFEFISICKEFKYSVERLRWYKLIKQSFEIFIEDTVICSLKWKR